MLYRKLIEEHLKDTGIILSDGRRELTFSQIHGLVSAYCAYFDQKGVAYGERVIVKNMDPIETILILLACIASGRIFVPMEPDITDEERRYRIQDCAPALILEELVCFPEEEAYLSDRKLQGKDTLVYILYTSGSTGVPRGVVASQKQILFCIETIEERLCHTEDDRILCSLPLSFDYGLYQVFLALSSGARLYVTGSILLQRIPYLLKKWKITGFPTISSVANLMERTGLLRNTDGFCLRYITFTGELLPVSLLQSLQDVLPETRLIPMYGLTECKRVSVMPWGRTDKALQGSCGLPLRDVRVWLENVNPKTQMGELVVEGPNVMEGYWNISDAENDVFFTNMETGKRCVRTKDLFRIDEEGFLYFCGRANRMLKIRGRRVSAAYLELQIGILPDIIEIAVINGWDDSIGEIPVIYVYTLCTETEQQIQKRMAKFPAYLQKYTLNVWRKPLPRNRNGKIDYTALQNATGGST